MIGTLSFSIIMFMAAPGESADERSPLLQLIPEIHQRLDSDYARLDALYRNLHAHPELALEEKRTAAVLAKELRSAGFAVTEKVGGWGIVGVLKNGAGPTVLVRADMDGLSIAENTGLPYASHERTRDSEGLRRRHHACLRTRREHDLPGRDRRDAQRLTRPLARDACVHRSAGRGDRRRARRMLDDGLFKRFPRPTSPLPSTAMPAFPTATSISATDNCKRMSIRWTSSCAAKEGMARHRT